MNKVIRNVGVDAGLIMVSDFDFFNQFKSKKFEERLSYKIDVPIGTYDVHWKIPHTWVGPVDGDGILEVTSGIVVVSDPCYLIDDHNEWIDLLNKTNYLQEPPPGTIVLDKMGGDGTYNVHLNLKRRK